MRYLEPEGEPPTMRTVFGPWVSSAEQADVEAHLSLGVGPVVSEVFSAVLWLEMLKLTTH